MDMGGYCDEARLQQQSNKEDQPRKATWEAQDWCEVRAHLR